MRRSKVQALQGQLSGQVPPFPSSVRYVLTPPIPVSELLTLEVYIIDPWIWGCF